VRSAAVAVVIGILICCVVGVLFALRRGGDEDSAAPGAHLETTELTLYCGAGIRPAAEALIKAFQAKHGVSIRATYAGSGRLLGQISALQTGDLFMPGAELYVDKAIENGLALKDTKRIAAHFVPVIFVRKGNPKNIRSLRDLARAGLRLGFGDERSCAVGKKTLKILEKNGIPYDDLKGNVVTKSATVNELGLAIQLGNVDAVILWDANARHFAEHGEVVAIPPEQNVLSPIPVIVLKSSRHVAAARRFVEFIASEEGRRILTQKGYGLPPRTRNDQESTQS
jgi:molybdate transport system substrate-binding protein